MAFCFSVCFCLRHQSHWITLKRKEVEEEEEDIVISAFICSNTGELVNNLSGFPQELQTIF